MEHPLDQNRGVRERTKKTLVIGASPKPERYSNMALNMLKDYGHEVVALGRREYDGESWQIQMGQPPLQGIHTVSLYLNPSHQNAYRDYLLELSPERAIFNPGTENPDLQEELQRAGIEAVEACTLVLLRTNQY